MIVEQYSAPYRDGTYKEFIGRTNAEVLIFSEVRENQHNHSEWNYCSPVEKYRCYSKGALYFRIDHYRKGVFKKLMEFRPDVLVTSSVIEGILAKIFVKSRIVLFVDTIKKGRYAHQWWNKILRTWQYRQADARWVPGKAGERYFKEFCKNKCPIFQGMYTNDAIALDRKMTKLMEEREELRLNYGFTKSDFVFLFIGKMIPNRHIEVLIESAQYLENAHSTIKILAIGNGPDFIKAQKYAEKNSNLFLIPSVPIKELEKYYVLADGYFHPGEEPYSLALYEAAIAGLPIVTSAKVGAAEDCMVDGENGYLFDFCNSKEAAEKMQQVADKKLQLDKIQRMRQFILNNRGVKWAAEQLMQACGITNS